LWIDIIQELDGGELLLKDRQGLTLLISTLKFGLQTQGYPAGQFPVELFYRPWKHSESQVEKLKAIFGLPKIELPEYCNTPL